MVRELTISARSMASTPRLSSLVNAREACIFQELAEIVPRMSTGMHLWNGASGDERLVRIQTALREALDDESLNLEIRGSQVKGTHTNLSDLDVIIRTPGRCVSRADKLAVVAKLRKNPMFHKSHVKLKRLLQD